MIHVCLTKLYTKFSHLFQVFQMIFMRWRQPTVFFIDIAQPKFLCKFFSFDNSSYKTRQSICSLCTHIKCCNLKNLTFFSEPKSSFEFCADTESEVCWKRICACLSAFYRTDIESSFVKHLLFKFGPRWYRWNIEQNKLFKTFAWFFLQTI